MGGDASGWDDGRDEREAVRGAGDIAVRQTRAPVRPRGIHEMSGVLLADVVVTGVEGRVERREVLALDDGQRSCAGLEEAAILRGVQLARECRAPSVRRSERGKAGDIFSTMARSAGVRMSGMDRSSPETLR
jgi:hypothetical protein